LIPVLVRRAAPRVPIVPPVYGQVYYDFPSIVFFKPPQPRQGVPMTPASNRSTPSNTFWTLTVSSLSFTFPSREPRLLVLCTGLRAEKASIRHRPTFGRAHWWSAPLPPPQIAPYRYSAEPLLPVSSGHPRTLPRSWKMISHLLSWQTRCMAAYS